MALISARFFFFATVEYIACAGYFTPAWGQESGLAGLLREWLLHRLSGAAQLPKRMCFVVAAFGRQRREDVLGDSPVCAAGHAKLYLAQLSFT